MKIKRKIRLYSNSTSLSILSANRIAKEMSKQYQKAEENLFYLIDSFSNNIKFQELYIDLRKIKKQRIYANDLRNMYTMFSENKAHQSIFDKIAARQIETIKYKKSQILRKAMNFSFKSKPLVSIQEEQQIQTLKSLQSLAVTKNFNDKQIDIKNQKQENNLECQANNVKQKQLNFLIKRVYCRLIQKMVVKISLYNTNKKYLNFICSSVLEITKNLQNIFKKFKHLKDFGHLQKTITKLYQQNLIIQQKIYQILVDDGYVMSMDQFYRVSGINSIQQQKVFQRKIQTVVDQIQIPKKQQKKDSIHKKLTFKQQKIFKINKQINDKYAFCILKTVQIIKDVQQAQQQIQQIQQIQQNQMILNQKSDKQSQIASPQSNFVKIRKKQKYVSKKKTLNFVKTLSDKKSDTKQPVSTQNRQHNGRKKGQMKSLYPLSKKVQGFSTDFVKLINEVPANMSLKGLSHIMISEKIDKLNDRSHSRRLIKTNNNIQPFNQQPKLRLKRDSSNSARVSKLIKLCQNRNKQRYSIDDVLGSGMKIPVQIIQQIKDQIMINHCQLTPNNSQTESQQDQDDQIQIDQKIQKSIQMRNGLLRNRSMRNRQIRNSQMRNCQIINNSNSTNNSLQKSVNARSSICFSVLKKIYNQNQVAKIVSIPQIDQPLSLKSKSQDLKYNFQKQFQIQFEAKNNDSISLLKPNNITYDSNQLLYYKKQAPKSSFSTHLAKKIFSIKQQEPEFMIQCNQKGSSKNMKLKKTPFKRLNNFQNNQDIKKFELSQFNRKETSQLDKLDINNIQKIDNRIVKGKHIKYSSRVINLDNKLNSSSKVINEPLLKKYQNNHKLNSSSLHHKSNRYNFNLESDKEAKKLKLDFDSIFSNIMIKKPINTYDQNITISKQVQKMTIPTRAIKSSVYNRKNMPYWNSEGSSPVKQNARTKEIYDTRRRVKIQIN